MLELLFNIVAGLEDCNCIKKGFQHKSCEYCEIFKNISFEEHLQTAASGSSLIYNMSATHERHECNTSVTLATRVRCKCDMSATLTTRVRNFDFVTTSLKTYFHNLIFPI